MDAVGTWRWTADYPGDAANSPSSVACGPASVSVEKAVPSLSLGGLPSSVTIGTDVSVGATIVNGFRPTGTTIIRFFGPDDPGCSSPVDQEVLDVDGAGPYVARFTPTRVGRWALTTSYSGDDANTSAALTCGSTVIAVTQAIPTLTPVSIPTTASAGDTLGASVWLNGGYQPAGRVQFRLFDPADPACAGVPTYVEEADLSDSAAATATGFTVPRRAKARGTGQSRTSVTRTMPRSARSAANLRHRSRRRA